MKRIFSKCFKSTIISAILGGVICAIGITALDLGINILQAALFTAGTIFILENIVYFIMDRLL